MPSILIIGLGVLGKDLLSQFPEAEGISHKELDITKKDLVVSTLEKKRPQVIINCAALTDIEYCEEHPDQAFLVNVLGVKNIAEAAQSAGSYLIHISSDYVVEPVNAYSKSKLAGETSVLQCGGVAVRMRYYNEQYWIIQKLLQGKKIKVLDNHYCNPLSSLSVGEVISSLMQRKVKGILSIGTKNKISLYEFACAAAVALDKDKNLVSPVSSFDWKVKRPSNVFIEPEQKRKLGIPVLTIQQDLEKFVSARVST